MRIATFWIAATILGTSTPVAAPAEEAAPVLDAFLPDGRITVALDEVASRPVLAPDQNIAVVELGRDAHTSHHAVAIRNREQPHRYMRTLDKEFAFQFKYLVGVCQQDHSTDETKGGKHEGESCTCRRVDSGCSPALGGATHV